MLGPWVVLSGATLGALVTVPSSHALALGAAGALALAARPVPPAVGYALLALAVVSGAHPPRSPSDAAALASGVPGCRFQGAISERLGKGGSLISLDRLDCEGPGGRGDPGVVAVSRSDGWIGWRVAGAGTLVPLGDSGFDAWRRRAGADAAMAVTEMHVFPPAGRPARLVMALRGGVAEAALLMTPPRGGLMEGLTIGETGGLPDGVEERLRRAGLSHLVAVSGSNVAIVAGAALLVTRALGRYASVVAAAFTLVLYVLTVGPEPSVLRASAMGALSLAALASGRAAEPLSALPLALAVVLAARPGMIHSVGLQLSAGATLGLILWAGPFAERFGRWPRPVALGLGATVAANIAVAPVLVAVFGEISLASPAANLLALPAVAPATILGLIAGVLMPAAPVLGELSARCAEPFVAWILAVGGALGAPGWAAVSLPRIYGLVLAVPVLLAALYTVRSMRTHPAASDASRLGR